MTISDILRTKGTEVITIEPGRTVLDAMRLMVRHNIGAVVVVEENEIHGILSERDGLKLAAKDPATLATKRVADIMTTALITASPGDGLHRIMDVMTQHRVRHLPIIDDRQLAGIVSIGDIVNACRASAEEENDQLREYIRGSVG
jgi:CBS domain-containing protein